MCSSGKKWNCGDYNVFCEMFFFIEITVHCDLKLETTCVMFISLQIKYLHQNSVDFMYKLVVIIALNADFLHTSQYSLNIKSTVKYTEFAYLTYQ